MPLVEADIQDALESSVAISDENKRFFRRNRDRLRDEYGGEIIAIVGGGVVDSIEFTEDYDELKGFIDGLRENYGERAVNQAYITYVPGRDEVLVI